LFDDLRLLPLAERTVQRYWACVRQLSEAPGKSPDQITPEELRQYFLRLKTERHAARQTATQAICAIKLFWEKTLHRPWPAEVQLVRANPQFKLPVVLSASEVRRILAAVSALDHRVCLGTIYSCGLRLGEGLQIEVRDIDAERMLLHVPAGKGNADRYVPLPERTLHRLREQCFWCSMLSFEMLPYPCGISSQIDDGPDHGSVCLHRVKDAIRKSSAEQPVVVLVNNAVGAGRDLEALDIGSETGSEIIAQAGLLCFIKQEALIQILKCILRDPDLNHGLPMVPFTLSHSRSLTEPSRTRARR
jgi:Phage integrase, N-terminal SAM-like domain/Phage integrase family